MQRLTALDEGFVDAESDVTPMNIGAVAFFDGELRLANVRERISSRLEAVPKMRMRLQQLAEGWVRPWWVEDLSFQIANHVNILDLGEPNEDEVLRATAGVMTSVLPRDRPLWEMRIVPNVQPRTPPVRSRRGEGVPRRSGLIFKFHHALLDGVSGIRLASLFLDAEPSPSEETGSGGGTSTEDSVRPEPHISSIRARLLVAEAGASAGSWAAFLPASYRWARNPLRTARRAGAALRGMAGFMPPMSLAPDLGLNRLIGPKRRYALLDVPIDGLSGARSHSGATLNELVLAAVTEGARRLCHVRGERTAGRALHVLVPVAVNLTTGDGSVELSNAVTARLVRIPLDFHRPTTVIAAAMSGSREARRQHHSLGVGVAESLAERLPSPLIGAVARAHSKQPFAHLLVTNMPGSPIPLYAAGIPMTEAYPLVPLGGNLPLNVGVFSYSGRLMIATAADPDAVPDLAAFVDGMAAMFETMTRIGEQPTSSERGSASRPPSRGAA